jgi:ABC-type uncharacterized transport system involved in gliding motility auxiliary subunit
MKRFAWVFAVLAVVVGIAAGSYYLLYREFDNWQTGLTIATGVLASAWLFFDRENVAGAANSRQFRYGSGAFSLVIIALCLTIGVNMLANKKPKRWDFTVDQRFTISAKTIGVLQGVAEPVTVTAFFTPWDKNEPKFRQLRDAFREHTDKVAIEIVNPYSDPQRAEGMGVTSDRGVVILQVGEKKQRLDTDFDQQAVTDALIRVTSGADHKICWMQGHGEPDPDDDGGRDAFGSAVIALENGNYTIAKRQPLVDGFDTCSAVVIARPETDWFLPELEAVAAYVASGGKLLVMLDPGVQGSDTPNLVADLARYGARVGNDLVIEDSPVSQQMNLPPYILMLGEPAGSFGQHPIVEKLHSFVIFEGSRSVSSIPGEGRDVAELIQTSDYAWAETDLDPSTPKGPDEGQKRTPLAIASTITDPATIGVRTKPGGAPPTPPPAPDDTDAGDTDAQPSVTLDLQAGRPAMDPSTGVPANFAPKAGGRVVVFGDSDFAGGSNLGEGNDKDLFINTIAWLSEEADQLGEQEDEKADNKLSLGLVSGMLVGLTSMLFVPGAFVGLGIAMMFRRRWL